MGLERFSAAAAPPLVVGVVTCLLVCKGIAPQSLGPLPCAFAWSPLRGRPFRESSLWPRRASGFLPYARVLCTWRFGFGARGASTFDDVRFGRSEDFPTSPERHWIDRLTIASGLLIAESTTTVTLSCS